MVKIANIKVIFGIAWLFLFFFWVEIIQAGQIQRVRGKEVIFSIEDTENFREGDKVFVKSSDGRKFGILQVVRVKGQRGLAKIIKGRAAPGMIVSPREDAVMKSEAKSGVRKSLGLLLSYSQHSMNVKVGQVENSYSDSTMGLQGFFDMPFSEGLVFRGKAGFLPFQVKKNAEKATLNYLSFEGSLNFYLFDSFWLGGGGAFLLALSKDSSVTGLDVSSNTNSFFFGGLGYDLNIGSNGRIPISFEYALFPGGAGVTANSLIFRAGYAWAF